MKGLTLEQVKKAGRFAWQDAGEETPFYNPHTGELCEFAYEGIVPYGESSHLSTKPYQTTIEAKWAKDGTDHVFDHPADSADEWYHLPGCDCEFCR